MPVSVSADSTGVTSTAVTSATRSLLAACPLCASPRLHYALSRGSYRVVRCADCRLMLLNPQPLEEERFATASEPASRIGAGTQSETAAPLRASSAGWRDALHRYRGEIANPRRMLHLAGAAMGPGSAVDAAVETEFDLTRVRLDSVRDTGCCGKIHSGDAGADCGNLAAVPTGSFDLCLMSDALERVSDPLDLLASAHRVLRPDGVLCIQLRPLTRDLAAATPDAIAVCPPTTSFDALAIQNALFLGGFDRVILSPGPAETTYVFARPAQIRQRKLLSIVIPAFNEEATFEDLLKAVLNKRLADLDIEIVIVESNSTDSTRQIAMRYAEQPGVRLILEDKPRGKGHAVRNGLAAATGDFILIQDADLEYDLEDYDVLLDPLVKGREALVLGSRHGGHAWWKMRTFADQPMLSLVFNCGHWFFTTLLNLLFGQRLKDPFTMFKVFRRDCLYGLEFKCNRFDFDYELLIKLIRKGYKPVEIPVNYRSRSYHEGKKVSAFRDPFNWLKALAWLRCTTIDPLGEVERVRRASGEAAPALRAQHPVSKAA